MSPIKVICALVILAVCTGFAVWEWRRRRRRFFESHSIEAEQLHAMLLATNRTALVQVFDVRQPLDLLAYSEMIPGSRRVPPKDILVHPELLPKDRETIVYCTCPSDATAIKIMQKAASLGYQKVKFLRGGLDAWKAKNYPVEPYQSSFHLDTPG